MSDKDQAAAPKSEQAPGIACSKAHDSQRDTDAALLIQRNYRGYRTRRSLHGMSLSADDRWSDAYTHLRLNNAAKAAQCGSQNDASSRWRRGGLLVGQIAGSPDTGKGGGVQDDGPVEGGPSVGSATGSSGMVGDVEGAQEGDKVDNVPSIAGRREFGLRLIERWTSGAEGQMASKALEEMHWMEMVDTKHRYGSNLKHYHSVWAQSDTKQNFFQWLDHGDGKKLDLDDCPRERLESEQVTYLSTEQRANYVVDIKDGKLIWRRNGKFVDTTRGKHKDLGQGRGIVELGPEEQEEEARLREERREARARERSSDAGSLSSSSSSSLSSSDIESAEEDERKEEAAHYGADKSRKQKRLGLLSKQGWTDALLRKTIGDNTWIYVLNSRRELFVGIKKSGHFQHSSFLRGGRVLSAGLLKAKDGVLTSLSPLSGHYRAGTAHFRAFVASLQTSGVNLDHVTLSKSILMLAALEQYGKLSSKAKPKKKSKSHQLEKENSKVAGTGDKGESANERPSGPSPAASADDARSAKTSATTSSASLASKTERDRPKSLLARVAAEHEAKAQEQGRQSGLAKLVHHLGIH